MCFKIFQQRSFGHKNIYALKKHFLKDLQIQHFNSVDFLVQCAFQSHKKAVTNKFVFAHAVVELSCEKSKPWVKMNKLP